MSTEQKILAGCFAAPSAYVLLWTAWNIRSYPRSLLLVTLAIVAAIGAGVWSFRTRTAIAIWSSAPIALLSGVLADRISGQFGSVTPFCMYALLSAILISRLVLAIAVLRWAWALSAAARRLLKVVGVVLAPLLVLFVPSEVYSTTEGYATWHFMLPGARLLVDGKPNAGFVHLVDGGENGFDLIITVQRPWREIYSVVVPTGKTPTVNRGYPWPAPRVPVFVTGDIHPPSSFGFESPPPNPPERKLVVASNIAEFSGDDGRRIRVEW